MDYLVKIRSVQTPLNGQFSIGANMLSVFFLSSHSNAIINPVPYVLITSIMPNFIIASSEEKGGSPEVSPRIYPPSNESK